MYTKQASRLEIGDRILIEGVYWEVHATTFTSTSEWLLDLTGPDGSPTSVKCDAMQEFTVAEA